MARPVARRGAAASSVSKGDRLEDQVFDLFTAEIKAGRFFAKPSCCKVFKKKGYYSRDRETEIVFDVAIEVSLPGEATHSVLVLLECKNYDHAVPVDDVEEFYAKTQQVGASKCKAIVVSTSAFQRGAFAFAQAKGIGLLRYFAPSEQKWILHRTPALFVESAADATRKRAYAGVMDEAFASRGEVFCGVMNDPNDRVLATTSIHTFFSSNLRAAMGDARFNEIQLPAVAPNRRVPYVDHAGIAERAEDVLRGIGYSGGAVSLECICSTQKEKTGLRVRTSVAPSEGEQTRGVLGRVQFSPLEIVTYTGSRPSAHAFTLAHELGHVFMGHGEYMSAESCDETDFESAVDTGDVARMEWQANHFASCLLLPKAPLLADVGVLANQYGLTDRGHGLIYVDDQPANTRVYVTVTDALRQRYGVSRAAVTYRLVGLGILNDARKRRAVRLGEVIKPRRA